MQDYRNSHLYRGSVQVLRYPHNLLLFSARLPLEECLLLLHKIYVAPDLSSKMYNFQCPQTTGSDILD